MCSYRISCDRLPFWKFSASYPQNDSVILLMHMCFTSGIMRRYTFESSESVLLYIEIEHLINPTSKLANFVLTDSNFWLAGLVSKCLDKPHPQPFSLMCHSYKLSQFLVVTSSIHWTLADSPICVFSCRTWFHIICEIFAYSRIFF